MAPRAEALDLEGALPHSLWRSMGDVGALGLAAPTAYGGLGLGHEAHCALMRKLSCASASVELSCAAHSNLCMRQIATHGTRKQCERWVPGLVEGSPVDALAMSEAEAGSDVLGMKLRAVRDAQLGAWILNGTKMCITNGPAADVFFVYAKTPTDPPLAHGAHAAAEAKAGGGRSAAGCAAAEKTTTGPAVGSKAATSRNTIFGTTTISTSTSDPSSIDAAASSSSSSSATALPDRITAFVLEKGMNGFSAAKKLDKLGMRGSETCELVLEDVVVPEENVLGRVGHGVYVLMAGLDSERLVLSAGPLGIMEACLDFVLPYVHMRRQFIRPIGEFQLMQGKLADMYTSMRATEALVEKTAREMDQRELELREGSTEGDAHSGSNRRHGLTKSRRDCAAAILFSAENATQMALQAVQALGGNGYINDYPAGRLLRDAKLYEIGAGTSEIRRVLIGRELFTDWSLPSSSSWG
jgi:alkylation response protein AidB-like acyl-CoA dehydrogenase